MSFFLPDVSILFGVPCREGCVQSVWLNRRGATGRGDLFRVSDPLGAPTPKYRRVSPAPPSAPRHYPPLRAPPDRGGDGSPLSRVSTVGPEARRLRSRLRPSGLAVEPCGRALESGKRPKAPQDRRIDTLRVMDVQCPFGL